MSLADQILAVNNDLPIRTDKPVHSGKVRSVYWLTDADSKRPLMENQAVSPLVDNKNTTSKAQNGEENKKKLLIDEENLTTKGGINLGTLLSGNGGSVLKEISKPEPGNHKVDCKEDEILPSLCQKIYGCVNGVPAAAKITAYMFAMAMSIALAMKLSTVLMT